MHLFKIPEWFVWTSFIVVFLATMWKGSWQARLISTTLFANMLFARGFPYFTGELMQGPHNERWWVFFVQDGLLLGIRLLCALTSRRYWTLWAAAICIDSIITGLLYKNTPYVSRFTYMWASYIWTYTVLGLLLSDVWLSNRDERRAAAQAAAAAA